MRDEDSSRCGPKPSGAQAPGIPNRRGEVTAQQSRMNSFTEEPGRCASGNPPAARTATSLFSRDDCSALILLELIDAHRAVGETSRDLQFTAHRLDVFAQRAHVHVGAPLQL